jgi:hypothetical protein
LYEDLHGFTDGGRLTDELKARSCRFFGTPRHEFAKRLVKERKRDRAHLKRWIERSRRAYLKKLEIAVKKGMGENPAAKAPLQRASGRFATVYAAGALAIKYGVFPLTRKRLLEAILRCQVESLGAKMGTPASSSKDKLIGYLQQHRAQFTNLDIERLELGVHKFGSVAGYAATFKGDKWLYLTAKQLENIIGSGTKVKALMRELAAAGLLATTETKHRHVVQRRIFYGVKGNKGFRSVYALKRGILDRVIG